MKKHTVVLLGSMLLLPMMAGCGNTTGSFPNTSSYHASSPNSTAKLPEATGETTSNVPWLHSNKDDKSISLDITAAQTDNNNGFNFNGLSNGATTVTVPLNWTVSVSFTNKSPSMPHSLVIVPYSERTSSGGFAPAFPGASTPQPEAGILAGQTQHFTFKADKAGEFAFVCAVPGHASDGLWDTFVVSSTATMPAVTMNSTSGSSSASGGGYY